MDRGNRRLQYLIAASTSTSSITSGFLYAWGTAVLTKFYNNETSFPITESEMSWIAAITSIGFLLGSFVPRYTSDRYGRRVTLLGSGLPVFVGTVILIFATKAWMICFARLLWGAGTGITTTVVMVYLTEIADKEIRGSISVSNRYMFSFGCFVMMCVGPFISYEAINYMILALPIWFFASCWWIPETPYFLVKEGRIEAARKTLRKLTSMKDEDLLEEKLSRMRSDVKKEMTHSSSFNELFTGKQYRKALIIVVGLKIPQILSGMQTIHNYMGLITQESVSGMSVSTALIIFGAVRFVLGIISSLLIDRLGRRPLMIYTFAGTTVCHAIVGAYFFYQRNTEDKTPNIYGYIPIVGIIAALCMASLGFQSIMSFIPAELFPMNIKSVAMTFINILSGFLHFFAVKSYQHIKDLVGLYGVFWFFGSVTLYGAVYAYILLPETKGKSFREIQIELHGNIDEEEYVKESKVGEEDNMTEMKVLNVERKNGDIS